MSFMRALGIHTYLGGFELGLRRTDLEVLGSVEGWHPAIEGREIAGLPPPVGPQPADLVFANPPCSRFSCTACATYSDEAKQELDKFFELLEVIDVFQMSGARILWWETGPNMWNRGDEMARAVHDRIGAARTLVVKYDPRWGGFPQRRPRTHVLHLLDDLLPGDPLARAPAMGTADMFRRGGEELRPNGAFDYEASWYDRFSRLSSGFSQGHPLRVEPTDRYVMAVLSGRHFWWSDEDRFWSGQEYAAAMDYPPEVGERLQPAVGGGTISLLSKGVSPAAAQWVKEGVLDTLGTELGEDWEDSGWLLKLHRGVGHERQRPKV